MLKADDTRQRTDIDDPPRSLLPHDRKHRAHQVHHAVEIGSDQLFDFGSAQLLEIAEQAVAGIVDEHVDASVGLDRLADRRLRLCLLGDVELDECEAVARDIVQSAADLSRWRPVATTRSPAFSAARAVAAPMPLPAPVMNQTLLMFNSCFRY
jgi:hypothetical protein